MSVFVKAGGWENELVEVLAAMGMDVGVHPYPNDARGYFLKHENGDILIRYSGSKYTCDTAVYVAERTVSMELLFVFRRLRDASGVYDVLERVAKHLLGYRLAWSTSGIEMESDDFIGEDNGIWQYGMKIHFTSDIQSDRHAH